MSHIVSESNQFTVYSTVNVPVDNIPGVSGIGEKGAIELLQQFDTLENMLEKTSEVHRSHPFFQLPVG